MILNGPPAVGMGFCPESRGKNARPDQTRFGFLRVLGPPSRCPVAPPASVAVKTSETPAHFRDFCPWRSNRSIPMLPLAVTLLDKGPGVSAPPRSLFLRGEQGLTGQGWRGDGSFRQHSQLSTGGSPESLRFSSGNIDVGLRSIAVHAVTHPSSSVAAQTSIVALCIASAVAVVWVLRAHQSDPPSLADANAWQWVSTAPGINVYIHERSREHSTHRVKAWVAFRYSNSPVSVNADVIELREFDCRQFLSRRLAGPFRGSASSEIAPRSSAVSPSAWRHDAPESMPGRIIAGICATSH